MCARNPVFLGIKKAELIAIEVAAPAKAGRLPSQMARGSMALAMCYLAAIMRWPNPHVSIPLFQIATCQAGCTAAYWQRCGDEALAITSAIAVLSKNRAITASALRKDRLPGSSSLAQLLMADKWTAGEDDTLRDAVAQAGGAPESVVWTGRAWESIAARVPGRTAWACAERWHNQLKPGLVTGPSTAVEDTTTMLVTSLFGTSWAELARVLRRGRKHLRTQWASIRKAAERLELTLAPGEAVSAKTVARVLQVLHGDAASYDAAAVENVITEFGYSDYSRRVFHAAEVSKGVALAKAVGTALAALPPAPVEPKPKRQRVRKPAPPAPTPGAPVARTIPRREKRRPLLLTAAAPSSDDAAAARASSSASSQGRSRSSGGGGSRRSGSSGTARPRTRAAAVRRKTLLVDALADLACACTDDEFIDAVGRALEAFGAIELPLMLDARKRPREDDDPVAADDASVAPGEAARAAIDAADGVVQAVVAIGGSAVSAEILRARRAAARAVGAVVVRRVRDREAEAGARALDLEFAIDALRADAVDAGAGAACFEAFVALNRANFNAIRAAVIASRRAPARSPSVRTSLYLPGAPPDSLVLSSLPPPHKWWWWWWWWWLCWCEWCIICGALSYLKLYRPLRLTDDDASRGDAARWSEAVSGGSTMIEDVAAAVLDACTCSNGEVDVIDVTCGDASSTVHAYDGDYDLGGTRPMIMAQSNNFDGDAVVVACDDAALDRGAGLALDRWWRCEPGARCPLGARVGRVGCDLRDHELEALLSLELQRGQIAVYVGASDLHGLDVFLNRTARHASTPRQGDIKGTMTLRYVRDTLGLKQSDSGTVPPYAHIDATLLAAWRYPVVSKCCSDTGSGAVGRAVLVPEPDWSERTVEVRVARVEGGRVTVVVGFNEELGIPSAVLWVSASAVDVADNPLSRASRAQMTLREQANVVLVLLMGLLAGSCPFYMGDNGGTAPSSAIEEGSLVAAAVVGGHWTDHAVASDCGETRHSDRLLQFGVYATLLVAIREAKLRPPFRYSRFSDAARKCARSTSDADRAAAGALIDGCAISEADWEAAGLFLAARPDGSKASRIALSELRETAFRGVVVHVERRLRVGAEPRAERIEAALRVMLGDERVDDSLRRAEASRQSWVTRRRRAA